jgi:phage gpG-like protein
VAGTTITSSIGSNVEYAGVHEFGFNEVVDVKGHLRRFAGKDQFAKVFEGGRLKRKRTVKGYVDVSGHQRRMNMPARMPIRRGIEDRAANYSAALSDRVLTFYARKFNAGQVT